MAAQNGNAGGKKRLIVNAFVEMCKYSITLRQQ